MKQPISSTPITPSAAVPVGGKEHHLQLADFLATAVEAQAEFWRLSAPDAIARCTPLPQRLLLRHTRGTHDERKELARTEALASGLVAMLLAAFVIGLFGGRHLSKGFLLSAVALIGVVFTAWKYMVQIQDPAQIFEQHHWIDFEQRAWHFRKMYAEWALPTNDHSIALDSLMVICRREHDDNGITYDVGLYKASEFDPTLYGLPKLVDYLHSHEDESEAHAFARTLATLWGVPGWIWTDATGRKTTQLTT